MTPLFLLIGMWLFQPSVNDMLREALRLQSDGKLGESAELFREVLKADPSLTPVHSNLGFVLSKLGRYEQAAAEYREALRSDPANFGLKLNLALSFYKMGRLAVAAEHLQELFRSQPDNPQVTMLLADCWLQLGENQKVIQLLQPLELRNTQDLAVVYALGTALIRDKQVAQGQRLVDRILSRGESAEAHFLLGTQMSAAGDYPAAVAQFAQAERLNPELPSLQSAYGKALLTTGDAAAAQAAFERELHRNSSDFDANLLLGEIFHQRGDDGKAEPLLRAALAVRPDSYDVRLDLAEMALTRKQSAEAQAELLALAREYPKDVRVHQDLASAYSALGDKRRSEEQAIVESLTSGTADVVLHAGSLAPDFALPDVQTHRDIRLHTLLKSGPVVLVLGSYTCPNFRQATTSINAFYREYRNRLPFYMVYIREAHAAGDWQTGRNEREQIHMDPANTMEEKADHANLCARKLKIDFPVLVDGLDGAVEQRYAAWPSRVFVIDRDRRVVYTSGLTELEFHPRAMQAALARLTPHAAE